MLCTRATTVHIIFCAHSKYSAAAWTDCSLIRGRHSAMHSFWPGWCCRDHQADRSLCYGDKGMDDNELAKMACWQDSLFDVTDTYSVISVQHQRFLLVTTASLHLTQLANLVPFLMYIWLWRRMLTVFTALLSSTCTASAAFEECWIWRQLSSLSRLSSSILIKRCRGCKMQQLEWSLKPAELYITIYNYLKTSLATGRIPHKVEDPVIDILYRAPHDLVSTYTTELLVPYTPPRTQSTKQLLVLQKSRLKTSVPEVLKLRLQHPGTVWVSLESQIRLQKTLTSVRRSLKNLQAFGILYKKYLFFSNVKRAEQLLAGYMC